MATQGLEERVVRYLPPNGLNFTISEPENWPSMRTTATTVQELTPRLLMDPLVPRNFQLYLKVPVPCPSRQGSPQFMWELSDYRHGQLPDGPLVEVRVVALPPPPPPEVLAKPQPAFESFVNEFNEKVTAGFQKISAEVSAGFQEFKTVTGMLMLGQFRPVSAASTKNQGDYRKSAIKFYEGEDQVASDNIKCMVTKQTLKREEIIAAHVYRKEWPPGQLLAMGKTINDPSNLLLMRKQVEKRFDKFEVTIIPQSEDVFKVVVLRPDLLKNSGMEQYIGSGKGDDNLTWAQIHETLLDCGSQNARPARRILAFHATLAIQHAEVHGWQIRGQLRVPQAGWESPDYDQGMMVKYLRDQAASSATYQQDQAEGSQEEVAGPEEAQSAEEVQEEEHVMRS